MLRFCMCVHICVHAFMFMWSRNIHGKWSSGLCPNPASLNTLEFTEICTFFIIITLNITFERVLYKHTCSENRIF